nr:MAG TPA: hypothetical protein [Ackermannviridae sp.]
MVFTLRTHFYSPTCSFFNDNYFFFQLQTIAIKKPQYT